MVVTVGDACLAYVAERRKSKGEEYTNDAAARFERSVYGRKEGERAKAKAIDANSISRVPLAKLRAERIREWRDGLGLSPGAATRTLTAFKAALNLAIRDRHASAELTVELRRVKVPPGGKKRRDLFLDLNQRRAFLKPAEGAIVINRGGCAHGCQGRRAGQSDGEPVRQPHEVDDVRYRQRQ